MLKNNPFSYFCLQPRLLLQLLCFAENTTQIMFSGKHNFSKTQLVKTTFSPKPKNTFFPKKRCHFRFWAIPLKPLFLLFSWVFAVLGPPKSVQNRKCARKLALFLPSWHKWCQAIFAKKPFCRFSHVWIPTFKNTIFIFLAIFHFVFFWSLLQQHKMTKTKMHFFRNPHFWHPDNFAKTLFWHKSLFWHKLTLFVFLIIPKKYLNIGEIQWKNLDQLLTLSLDQF